MINIYKAYFKHVLSGYPVFATKNLYKNVQFKFPHSKKKRIRKKWAKNPKYFKQVEDKESIRLIDNKIFVHPELKEVLDLLFKEV